MVKLNSEKPGASMELSPKQQIAELIKSNQRILIVGHKNSGGDLIGSMLALERVLVSQGKEVSLVLSEGVETAHLFLPGVEKIGRELSGQRDLIVRIDKNANKIEKIAYNEENGFLNIVITPSGKAIAKSNLNIVDGNYKYDLIFVLDTQDVEKIDPVYDKYTELFFEVPIINIDHHAGNEHFGTVNLVDMTATSTAEILVSIIEAIGPGNFDADVATCLLTGLIADTASFKNTNTTPKSLTISAQMLAAGARQQEIIQNLYKARPIQTLKLWGKLLSGLEYDAEHRIVYTVVNKEDLSTAKASIEDVQIVLDELLSSTPGTDIVLVLVENNANITGLLRGLNGQDVLSLAEGFGGNGKALEASFEVQNATIANNKEQIITKIMNFRDAQLGKPQNQPISVMVEKAEPPKVAVEEVKITEIKVIDNGTQQEDVNELISIEKTIDNTPEEIAGDNGFSLEEIFTPTPEYAPVEEDVVLEVSDDSIEKALESIDLEIEGAPVPILDSPNIDIEEVKTKSETLQKIGEVMRGYKPGTSEPENGNQPIDSTIWKK
ncbi:MAG: DHH family phosphoesterase [bacterium]